MNIKLSKEAIQEPKKTRRQALGKDVKVQLAYKSSPEAEFRLFKALSMILTEGDILNITLEERGRKKELEAKKESQHSS